MKKKFVKTLCLTLAAAALLSTGAMAADAPEPGSLTSGQIARLQACGYTRPENAVGYEEAKTRFSESALKFLYGDRSGFDDFATAREHLYHTMERSGSYYFPALDETLVNGGAAAFFQMVVREAAAEVSCQSERLTVTFHADESCIYQSDSMDRTTAAVRGVVEVRLHVRPTDLTGSETALLCSLGFTQLYQDKTMFIDVDVHMNTQPKYNVSIHTIVPLGESY